MLIIAFDLGGTMIKFSPRKDRETAAQIKNAGLAVQFELGDDAARKFLNELGVRRELTDRALTAAVDQRRVYCGNVAVEGDR